MPDDDPQPGTTTNCGDDDEGSDGHGHSGPVANRAEKLVDQLVSVGITGFGVFDSARDSAATALRGRSKDEAVARLVIPEGALCVKQRLLEEGARSALCR